MTSKPRGNIKVKLVETQTEKESCFDIRTQVFVGEQGVDITHEIDGYDETCVHAIAFVETKPVGTGRMIHISDTEAQIGRMAVLPEWRRSCTGTKILDLLEDTAKTAGITRIVLHAQVYVQNFYEVNGYTATGDIFLDENIEHILMYKEV
tara:strand:- start:16678 stop:17127 length:450 start_codon:yes stop_codon:yes gene_type:complete